MKKLKLRCCLALFALCYGFSPLQAQQWYVKSHDFSSAINQKPDYRTSGTYVTTDAFQNATGVLVYGTMGYTDNELSGAEGGFGAADGVILYNDLDGSNIWTITLGTSEPDVISRVVQDSDGNLAVTGYTQFNGETRVFLAKLDGMTQSILWADVYGKGVATDMINVNESSDFTYETTGYAVSGNNEDGSAFVFYTKTDGTNEWAHNYTPEFNDNLNLNALIQPKIGLGQLTPPRFANALVLAGKNGSWGYMMSLDLTDGALIDDLRSDFVSDNCANFALLANEYVSLDQNRGGDIVLYGYYGVSRGRIMLTSVSNYGNFTVNWNRIIFGGGEEDPKPTVGFPLDINTTKQGYLGIFEYEGGENGFKMVEYDFNGNITRMDDLSNSTNWFLDKEKQISSGGGAFPYVDFSLECGRAFHFSGTETIFSSNPPAGWSVDNIPHARIRLNTESCIETELNIGSTFCSDYFTQERIPLSTIDSDIQPDDFNELQVGSVVPNISTYCESSCPQSACESFLMVDIEGIDIVTLNSEQGVSWIWSTGQTSNSINVFVRDDFSEYSVDQIDQNGCITTMGYFVPGKGRTGKKSSLSGEVDEYPLSVYPNPANDWLTVEVPMEGVMLSIHDMTGRLVKLEKDLTPGAHNINISSYPEGIYVIRLSGKGVNKEFKISKE